MTEKSQISGIFCPFVMLKVPLLRLTPTLPFMVKYQTHVQADVEPLFPYLAIISSNNG